MTELDAGNNESGEFKVKAIWDSAVLQKSQRVIYQGFIIWFFEKLSGRRKYLGACIGHSAS